MDLQQAYVELHRLKRLGFIGFHVLPFGGYRTIYRNPEEHGKYVVSRETWHIDNERRV